MRTLIHIGGDARSGGSLLCRLLDGHPNVGAYPFECEYFEDRNGRLASFQEFMKTRDYSSLESATFIRKFEKFANGVLHSKLHYDDWKEVFSYDDFISCLHKSLDGINTLSDSMVFDLVSLEFFKEFYQDPSIGKSLTHVVNHCSRTFVADLDKFFDVFPDGYFVHILRDPRSIGASMKRFSNIVDGTRVEEFPSNFADILVLRWLLSLHMAIENKRRHGFRYIVVRYEDLVLKTEQWLRQFSTRIGIEYSQKLTKPTMIGQGWSGNSSFGKLPVEISDIPMGKHAEILTEEELETIESKLSPFIDHLDAMSQEGDFDYNKFDSISELVRHRIKALSSCAVLKRKELRQRFNTMFVDMREMELGRVSSPGSAMLQSGRGA